eukprot:TRINITY_DN6442_c0_g1_i1.p1 TRINITY_DN6442_c0_g1~~TRINITY_DN6442_c0_g1_i1.p1  ORF type:complete len:272 (-),score=51.26 TRINITY_DN6442_c0_g1_i1:171-986(-)
MLTLRSLLFLSLLAVAYLPFPVSAYLPPNSKVKVNAKVNTVDYTAADRDYADNKAHQLGDLIKWFTERGGLSGPWAAISRTKDHKFRLQAREDIGPGDTIIQVDKATALSKTPPVLTEHWVMYKSGLAELFDLIAGYSYDKVARHNAITLWFLHMESCLDRINEDTGEAQCSTFTDEEWAPFFIYYRDLPLVNIWDLVDKKLLDKYGEGPTGMFTLGRACLPPRHPSCLIAHTRSPFSLPPSPSLSLSVCMYVLSFSVHSERGQAKAHRGP